MNMIKFSKTSKRILHYSFLSRFRPVNSLSTHSHPHLASASLPSYSSPHRSFSSLPEDPPLPVSAVVSFLDAFHLTSGLPWWMVIASSTVAFRIALLPLLILQLKKLKRISESFPKLPPFPTPMPGRSFVQQFSHFWKESRAIGCPSFLWFLAYPSIQVPCFFLLMTSIRKMSLDNHPGFDCGGALWFQNLNAFPHGVFGPIFPILIASLHYIIVQISFDSSSIRQTSGLVGFLLKYYKLYLDLLSLPLFFVGFFIPQGSLVYWVTNSSLTVVQQLSLKHPFVAAKLGLLDRNPSVAAENFTEVDIAELKFLDSLLKEQKPEELLAFAVQLLSKGSLDKAYHLLQLALDKDPGYVRGLVLMGQVLLQKKLFIEATEYLERAISKLVNCQPLEVEDIDLLILASQWTGAAYVYQGKMAEGITHLERVAGLSEPDDSNSRSHYYDGLLLLSSALYKEGRKAEAAKYLRMVVAFNPAYEYLLEQCQNDDNDLASDLASSRRGNYS